MDDFITLNSLPVELEATAGILFYLLTTNSDQNSHNTEKRKKGTTGLALSLYLMRRKKLSIC